MSDMFHVPSVYVACEGMSDLGNGPNKPTATIIGQYSASSHDGALILSLERARILNFRIRLKSGYIFGDTSLMSDMFLVCM